MREYGKDLDAEWVKHICAYYLEILQPLFARSLSGEVSRGDLLAKITSEKIMAWKSVVAPGEFIDLRPQRGFVENM